MCYLTNPKILLPVLILGVSSVAKDDLDSIKVDPAHHKVVFENEQVRVVRWEILPGDKTLEHTHPNNLSIALTDYNGEVKIPARETEEVHLKSGSINWREAGAHVVENKGKETMLGVLVEPKKPASARPAGSADPAVVDAQHQTVEFENEQIRVIRERGAGSFPMHGHPDNVQVLLTDLSALVTTAEGKTETVRGKSGEIRWRPATQHAGKILGEQPMEQIIVEMKGGPSTPTASVAAREK